MKHFLLAAMTFILLLTVSCRNRTVGDQPQIDAVINLQDIMSERIHPSDSITNQFSLWNIKKNLPEGKDKELIQYGYEVLANTAKYVGPYTKDPSKRYAGNNLACQNCHINVGAKAYSGSWIGVVNRYPVFRGKSGKVNDIYERVQGCFQYSMNGIPLPKESREMQAIVAYFEWLSTDSVMNKMPEYKGFLSFNPPARAADTVAGRTLYINHCAVCHGETGQGVFLSNNPADGYVYPPVWGGESYNLGAGMSQTLNLAGFIKGNMPYGVTFDEPGLNDEDIFDISGYINTRPRAVPPGLDKNFPDRTKKRADIPYGPYVDPYTEMQHRMGPYQPIDDFMNSVKSKNAAAAPASDKPKESTTGK